MFRTIALRNEKREYRQYLLNQIRCAEVRHQVYNDVYSHYGVVRANEELSAYDYGCKVGSITFHFRNLWDDVVTLIWKLIGQ